MPHLHLPVDHTDADLVLAANLADVVGSEDLYVAWTQERGAGVPEVEAVISQERPASPFAEVLVALAGSCIALWQALTGRPNAAPEGDTPAAGAARWQTESDELRH